MKSTTKQPIVETDYNQYTKQTVNVDSTPMPKSRASRLDERKTKKQLLYITLGIFVILILVATIGIPLLINMSVIIGNLGNKNEPTTQNANTDKPFPPSFNFISEATNSATLKLSGFAPSETTLKLFVNDEEVESTLVGLDGEFSFSNISLKEGGNKIHATATDAAGNESDQSETFTVVYSKKAPKLEVSEPAEGATFKGSDNQEITVKGATDPNAEITINDRFVSVKANGDFEYKLKLSDGESTLKVIATDEAGNTSTKEIKVTYTP